MKFSKAVQILKANNMEKSIKASKTIDLLKGIVKKENKSKKNAGKFGSRQGMIDSNVAAGRLPISGEADGKKDAAIRQQNNVKLGRAGVSQSSRMRPSPKTDMFKKGLTSKSYPMLGIPNRLSIEDSATRVPSASPFRVSSVSIPAMMNQAVYKSCEVHGSLYKSTGNCVRCSVSKSMQCRLGHDLVKSTSHGFHCPKCK